MFGRASAVPGGLTQLGLGLGLGAGALCAGLDCHFCPSPPRVYLHVRPDCLMTMDYFLLLCSLLLPVVSAVEGKKSALQLLFAMPSAFSPPPPPFPPRHVSPSPGRSWVPQRVRLLYTQVTFFFCHPQLKFTILNKVAIWVLFSGG